MTIWGHEHVKIEKDGEKRCWYVRTTAGALLCTVPWSDAFREFKGAPDYAAAVATCMGNQRTTLTDEEERDTLALIQGKTSPTNIVAVDFKRKRRL